MDLGRSSFDGYRTLAFAHSPEVDPADRDRIRRPHLGFPPTLAVPILARNDAPGDSSVSAAQNRRASRWSRARIGAPDAAITCPREASIGSARLQKNCLIEVMWIREVLPEEPMLDRS